MKKVKRTVNYFDLNSLDLTGYEEVTGNELFLINGGRQVKGNGTKESEYVPSSTMPKESESSSKTSASENSNSSKQSSSNPSSQKSNTEQESQQPKPTCTAAEMAAAKGAAANAYFESQDKKRQENTKKQKNTGTGTTSNSTYSQSDQTKHTTNDQYSMAQKDYDEHYGKVSCETSTKMDINEIPEGIYYLESGEYFTTVGSAVEDVYILQEEDCKYVCSKTDFDNMTAAVVGEASILNNFEEACAIADVIMNCATYANVSVSTIIENGGIYGFNDNSINRTQNEMCENTDKGILNARAAVIDAFVGNTDSSKGAYFWEGNDLLRSSNDKRLQGIRFPNPEDDIYNIGDIKGLPDYKIESIAGRGNYDYTWESTVSIGGTVFIKYDETCRRVTGQPSYRKNF